MTGAALPYTANTVIGYEDIEIKDGIAMSKKHLIKKGKGIHYRGSDKTEK